MPTSKRESKALKIVKILQDNGLPCDQTLSLLDIGTGNGEIAYYLSRYFQVTSLDVVDQRQEKSDFDFILLPDSTTSLPFTDDYFDIVISNHVIEHVPDSKQHLAEINRVLKTNGIVYLATPNRLWPWEVHYRIWFLHYLPDSLFLDLLKKTGRFHEPLHLLSWFGLVKQAAQHFLIQSESAKICKWPGQYYLKVPPSVTRYLAAVPLKFYQKLTFIHPTLIVILRKKQS